MIILYRKGKFTAKPKKGKKAIGAKFLSLEQEKNSGLTQVLRKLNENFPGFFDLAVKKLWVMFSIRGLLWNA
jgi:hypothetical protein